MLFREESLMHDKKTEKKNQRPCPALGPFFSRKSVDQEAKHLYISNSNAIRTIREVASKGKAFEIGGFFCYMDHSDP